MSALLILLIALAGGVGAVARFTVDGALRSRFRTVIPWSTVVINIAGSALLGLLVGLTLQGAEGRAVEAVLGIGFLGGFTTFSTASVETARLIHSGRWGRALVNALGTASLALLAAALGIAAGVQLR